MYMGVVREGRGVVREGRGVVAVLSCHFSSSLPFPCVLCGTDYKQVSKRCISLMTLKES